MTRNHVGFARASSNPAAPNLFRTKIFFTLKEWLSDEKSRILLLTTSAYSIFYLVGVSEWLTGMTRNHVGFSSVCSNPVANELFWTKYFLH